MNTKTETIKVIPASAATTPLQKAARKWLNDRGADYDNGAEGAFLDLMHGGCASGIVGKLIYTADTVKFFRKHRTEIAGMLAQAVEDFGVDGPAGVFGEKWDKEDPLAMENINQNLLAFYGFEEAARNVFEAAGGDY